MKAIFFFVLCLFAVAMAAPEPAIYTSRVIGTPLSYVGTPLPYKTLYPGHIGYRTYGGYYPYTGLYY